MSDVLDRAANVGLDVVELAQELIRRPSLTPDDAGCQSLIAEQLRPFDFAIEQIDFNDVLNMWAVRGEAAITSHSSSAASSTFLISASTVVADWP